MGRSTAPEPLLLSLVDRRTIVTSRSDLARTSSRRLLSANGSIKGEGRRRSRVPVCVPARRPARGGFGARRLRLQGLPLQARGPGYRLWRGRPEWARPAFGGIALGCLLLAMPQMYWVGYPVMDKAISGRVVLWLLVVLRVGKPSGDPNSGWGPGRDKPEGRDLLACSSQGTSKPSRGVCTGPARPWSPTAHAASRRKQGRTKRPRKLHLDGGNEKKPTTTTVPPTTTTLFTTPPTTTTDQGCQLLPLLLLPSRPAQQRRQVAVGRRLRLLRRRREPQRPSRHRERRQRQRPVRPARRRPGREREPFPENLSRHGTTHRHQRHSRSG